MKLNLRQKRILELLAINSRFSNKDIAKSVKTSEDTVEYQIDKLVNKEKVGNFFVQFDHFQLNCGNHHILIKLKDKNVDWKKLVKIDEIISINTSFGIYDLQLVLTIRNALELNNVLNKIKKIIKIKEIEVCEFTDYYKQISNVIPEVDLNSKIPKNQKNFIYKLNRKQYGSNFNSKIKLDSTDKKIIKALLDYPRRSYQELSKISKVNHETIRYRIRKYIENEFILNFGLFFDFKKFGYYTNYFLFKLENQNDTKIIKLLQKEENIFYSAKLNGKYNMICYVISKNPKELGEIFDRVFSELNDYIIESNLLFLDEFYKYVQFPMQLLK